MEQNDIQFTEITEDDFSQFLCKKLIYDRQFISRVLDEIFVLLVFLFIKNNINK